MPKLSWRRIAWGVLIGVILLALVYGIWYWYAIWFPAWQTAKVNASVEQVQRDFWQAYCTTGKYKNAKVRSLCLKLAPDMQK